MEDRRLTKFKIFFRTEERRERVVVVDGSSGLELERSASLSRGGVFEVEPVAVSECVLPPIELA